MTMIKNMSITTGSETVDCENVDKGKNKKSKKKHTYKQKIALVMLAIVDFMSFCSMSIMAPFYPQEAATKGMSESLAGFVFGFYALVVFLSSPVFGKTLPKIGLMSLFTGGLLISGLCSIIFGTLHLIDDYMLFTTFSFLVRGLGALGSSAYATASYVIIVNLFPDHAGAVRGLLETFVGLGMSVGPALGALLFTIGGFGLPFYVLGFIIILIAPLSLYLIPAEKCALEVKSGSFTELLKIPSLVVTCCITVVIAMTFSFLDPTLEPHLRKFKLSPGNIGLIFLLLSAMYGIFSPAWGCLTDRLENYWCLMTTGLFFSSITLLLLGPSPLLPFLPDSIWLNVASLAILGVAVAMALMPTYQAILDSALQENFEDNLGTHSLIAGLWSSVYSLGEVLGPVIGGALLQNYGFPVTSTVFSFFNLVMAVLGTLYFSLKRKKISNCDEVEKHDQNFRHKETVIKPIDKWTPKLV